jgi:calcineurin-like phosphoesterase family protein
MEQMKTWLTSDIHFGHANIIGYCNRPFETVDQMDKEIIRRWNNCISENDDVFFLGDFAFAKAQRIVDILSQLNFKHLMIVPGNHDTKLISMWEHPIQPVWVCDGVVGVSLLPPLHEMVYEGTRFVLCHYPLESWHWRNRGTVHLHGHRHTQFTPTQLQQMVEEKRYDVGVDMYGGPVQLTGDLRFLNDAKGWA